MVRRRHARPRPPPGTLRPHPQGLLQRHRKRRPPRLVRPRGPRRHRALHHAAGGGRGQHPVRRRPPQRGLPRGRAGAAHLRDERSPALPHGRRGGAQRRDPRAGRGRGGAAGGGRGGLHHPSANRRNRGQRHGRGHPRRRGQGRALPGREPGARRRGRLDRGARTGSAIAHGRGRLRPSPRPARCGSSPGTGNFGPKKTFASCSSPRRPFARVSWRGAAGRPTRPETAFWRAWTPQSRSTGTCCAEETPATPPTPACSPAATGSP